MKLEKKLYNSKSTENLIDRSFIGSKRTKDDDIDVPKFFQLYDKLFYNIPKSGAISHSYIINKSSKYAGGIINTQEQEIQNLKNIGNPPTTNEVTDEPTNTMDTTPPPIDGETCMHGNSWNSNCSECDDLDDVEVALNEMGNIIDNEPNDTLLGKKIRDFYNSWIEFNETNSDNTNNIDI